MSLHQGLDTVAWVSLGLFTKTYDASEADQDNINKLFVSLGLIETSSTEGGYHYWPNIWGWPWRKIFKGWK